MPKNDPIKPNDLEFLQQLQTFDTNIAPHATALGVTTAQITAHHNDTIYFGFVVASMRVAKACGEHWVSWKDLVRGGGNPPPDALPTAPIFPADVAAVGLGIETRFRDLIQQIKVHPGYNPAIGRVLDIEGTEMSAPDYTILQPELKLSQRSNGVQVAWNFGPYAAFLDALKLVCDRGDGKGETLVTVDSTPGYLDTTPFPTAPARWTYRAVYIVKDQPVGLWSKPVTINVG